MRVATEVPTCGEKVDRIERLGSVSTRRWGHRLGGFAAVAAAVAVIACAPDNPAANPAGEASSDLAVAGEIVLDGLEVVLSDAAVDLSFPAAIDVDADGNIWVVDRRLHQMLVVSPEGEVLRTIGRNGAGPGEFRGPRGLAVRGDRVYVLDNVHGVQVFDMEGNYLSEYPAVRILFDFDFTGDGGLVTNNNRVWVRGAMIAALSPGGGEPTLFGELPFPDTEGFNFRALQQQVMEGTIPDVLRNGALPVVAADGSLWVVIHTESTIRRYGPDGTLLSETSFDLPEMPGIVEQYLTDFAELPGGDAFFFPSFVGAAVAIDDSLLLLWETVEGEPGLVTVHGPDGAIVQRWPIPELDMGGGGRTVMDLAVDVERRRLYISISDIATIFGIDLPDPAAF